MVIALFTVFFILLILGVPIAFSLALSSIVALLIGSGDFSSILIVGQKMFSGLNSFPIMAIPLFLLAGNIMTEARISERLILLASIFVGRFRGGLAHATTGASAFFGSISGSAPATTAAIGTISIPEMVKRNYPKDYSAAVVAASGVLGIIIPPSINMVLYGVTAGVSIGDLFISGIIPGLMIALGLMMLNYFIAIKKGFPTEEPLSTKEKLVVIYRSLLALLMPFIILGGIYSGAFTPTEAAAIACLYGLIIGFFVYRTLTFKNLHIILKKTAQSSAMIMILIATAHIFGYIISSEQVPQKLAALLLGITDNPTIIMLIILVGLLIIGTFLENIAAIVLVVPTIMGVIEHAQIDPLYFGVFMIIALAVGQITPPLGLNLFVASDIAGIKFEAIIKQTLPYIAMYIVFLLIFIFFPSLLTILVE